jgi:aryl-alcohol dehydrogenase-like predicted oxidoreductase
MVYGHANGNTIEETLEAVSHYLTLGYKAVRAQCGVPGIANAYGIGRGAMCRAANVGMIARVPLDEGSLGGKLTPQTSFPSDDWRHPYFNPENLRETLRRVEALRRELPDGMSLPEAALRFVLSYPDVSTTIVGMRKAEYVQQNVPAAAAGPLSPELLGRLRQHRWNRSPTAKCNAGS